ncbi:MAG TPA: hypothetical protein VLK37_01390 [Solirubrobacterales bacterium]|nr:hypothetical protein [Solirubrobacterales bacterium]
MTSIEIIDQWTTKLTGLPADRIARARERIDAFGIEHLSNELTRRPDIDSAAACCMVDSAIDALAESGIEESKLVAKLRGDRDVWPTVTELIAGRSVLRVFDADLMLELDSGTSASGPNADFRLKAHDSALGISVEFKAIGLSHAEIEFFQRMAPLLPDMCPESGVLTSHIAFDNPRRPHIPSRVQRRANRSQDRRRQKKLPPHIRDLHGAVAVAHDTEHHYLTRVQDRIETALRQLSDRDDCWVALWWSNGAPAIALRQAFTEIDLPEHVLGVMLFGAAVAVPSAEIHYYDIILPRNELDEREIEPPVLSLEDNPLGQPIFDALHCSASIRPTLLQHPVGIRGQRQPLLVRDGSRSIFPFNLLIAPDPPQMRSFVTQSEGSHSP